METDDAGLRLARYIRDELNNRSVRIVLRTGQPGQALEDDIIVRYDVNDYKAKTELTARKLFATTVTALRAYEHLKHLDAHRRGLQQIIDTSDALSEERSLQDFASSALRQLGSFVGADADGSMLCLSDSGAGADDCIRVLAAGNPDRVPREGAKASQIAPEARALILSTFERKCNQYGPVYTTLYLGRNDHGAIVACLPCAPPEEDLTRPLIELLCSKIAIGFNNVDLYERLTQANALLEKKVDNRTRELVDVNARLREANEELRRRALLDALTELPNRLLFEDRLNHAVARCARDRERVREQQPEKLAVLFIDLDGFKPVNDSFGHTAGDLVLKEVALRLRAAARACDTPARVGGDEFLLLMEDVAGLADGVAAARRLVEVLAQPFDIAGRQMRITASIGVVVYPDHGSKDKLVAHADAAMYAAKRAGGNSYAVFESHMDARAMEQLCLQTDLRGAVERNELELRYQPKVDGRQGQVSGVEALLRWRHPERGMIGPNVFIPLAERFGLINALGNWVIDEVCRQMRAWADAGTQMRVAVNLSVHQLRQDDVVERIQRALLRHRLPASQLLCEITESVAMEDIKATQKAFEGLERIGVYLSIDDFGTGYSSLSYLRQLPARQLKIDRSFINDLASSSDAAAVVKAVIHLAHALGLRVVAEGVETRAQRDILLQLDCDELQGYFYARPMPADAVLAWTADFKA